MLNCISLCRSWLALKSFSIFSYNFFWNCFFMLFFIFLFSFLSLAPMSLTSVQFHNHLIGKANILTCIKTLAQLVYQKLSSFLFDLLIFKWFVQIIAIWFFIIFLFWSTFTLVSILLIIYVRLIVVRMETGVRA